MLMFSLFIYLFIYLFIIECCTEGKLLTQLAKKYQSLGDKFSSLGYMSPGCSVKFVCLFAWRLTALSARIVYIAP